jgi:hypothetical protein
MSVWNWPPDNDLGMPLPLPPGSGSALGPLIVDRTVYVNSATGSDSANGSVGAPFQTLARAWADRLLYGELRAKYTVQLLGVGPYTMPVMQASVCGDSGFFLIMGDATVDVAIASGTFTGPLVTSTMAAPTSAGLGSDTLRGSFIEITSGAWAGYRNTVLFNADASITLANKTAGSFNFVNGDTFRVYRPGTVINCPVAASGQASPGVTDWSGTRLYTSILSSFARHNLYNLALSGVGLCVSRSNVGLVGVYSTLTNFLTIEEQSRVWTGGVVNGFVFNVGTDTATNKLYACGLAMFGTATLQISGSSMLVLIADINGSTNGLLIGAAHPDEVYCLGLRLSSGCTIQWGRFETVGVVYLRLDKTSGTGGCFTCTNGGWVALTAGLVCVFANTAGSCIQIQSNSNAQLSSTNITGGTTDAAGFAIKLLNGGGRVTISGALAITGGTAGSDIKTTNITKPKAFLAAASDFISDMGGSEVITRI